MFAKILIAEDIDIQGIGLDTIFKKLPNAEIVETKYCDDALLKIKRALHDNAPFDLLLTDLSFIPDHRSVKLSGGEELISAAREVQPGIKILVCSVEDRIYKIRSLFDKLDIDGFVWKGRESEADMGKALEALSNNEKFLSQRYAHLLRSTGMLEISEYDVRLITLLAEGFNQTEISEQFKKEGRPNSLSSIEKNINRLKISLRAKNAIHLVSIAKDLGII